MDLRPQIQSAIAEFPSSSTDVSAANLWEALGYTSEKKLDIPSDPETFFNFLNAENELSRARAHLSEWKSAHFLFQLSNDEIPSLARRQLSLIIPDTAYRKGIIESFVFIALDLNDIPWTRTELAQITREVNRGFPMPAILLFKHGERVSIAVIDRRVNRRDASKTVVDSRKVSIIKDVDLAALHRAHLEILNDLGFANVGDRTSPSSFRDLYEAWMNVLSIRELNRKFYDELLTWYLWATRQAKFPKGQPVDDDGLPSVAIIRLLTRLIFVWFVREKHIVPEALFDKSELVQLLREPPSKFLESSSYYKAVLQNLFFATLNTEAADRRWKYEGSGGLNSHYLIHSVYRYRELFNNPDRALELFSTVPFLNGGLFECLDREVDTQDLEKNPELEAIAVREANRLVLRVDGFSERNANELSVPNRLFFSEGEEVDLNTELGTKGKKRTARGLIEIFSRYKFTIEENTPIEEEIALDPELLGKVFENLLASYNEDTKTTARKLSGSFYTPRVVVDYMVDEALLAHFETHLKRDEVVYDLDTKLRRLLSFGGTDHDFGPLQVDTLISSIEDLRALDLACGSGAFLMGMLQKLVHVLSKLDPHNTLWKEQNRRPLATQLCEAEKIHDPALREDRTEEAADALAKLDVSFSNKHYADYSRKLYLVEKCLFGVDIQPIAVQIAKLRFFISLVVSQRSAAGAENWNITALPNLETKLVAANSLLPIDRPVQATLRDIAVDDKEIELRSANERHFAARSTKSKRRWRDKISELRDELAELLEQDHLLTKESAKQVVRWNPFDQNGSALFFDPEWMFGLKDGFDIVIGNPPYVRHENIKEQKPAFQKTYACYAGTADLYVYFYERSIRLLKPEGAFAFITSNKWYRANYGVKLRQWMNQNTLLRRIIDFGDEAVFEAMAYPTILVSTRREHEVSEASPDESALALNWERDMKVDNFPNEFAQHAFRIPQTELRSTGWEIEGVSYRELLSRVKAAGTPLNIWCDRRIYRGITTGLNDAFIVPGRLRRDILDVRPESASLFFQCIRGRDVKRWQVKNEDYWLIKIESSENATHPWSGLSNAEAWDVFSRLHPSVACHFDSQKDALQARQDKGTYYWELRSCAFWPEFAKPKVYMPAIERSAMYAPVLEELYGNNKTHFVVTDDWRYLSAILNSPVSWWFTQRVFTAKAGGYYEFIPQFVGQIPIPPANARQKSIIAATVDIILRDPSNAARWEQLLNGLVYELFFPADLYARGMRLFDELERLRFQRSGEISEAQADEFAKSALHTATVIFKNDHAIYRMLFDLRALPTVRIIEGKE